MVGQRRMTPEVGDIVFVMHTKNWISKLFAGVMGSKWSHSALVYGKLNGELVLLETNDGRPHLDQAVQVIKAGKTLFIDKPVAGSLRDVGIIVPSLVLLIVLMDDSD